MCELGVQISGSITFSGWAGPDKNKDSLTEQPADQILT